MKNRYTISQAAKLVDLTSGTLRHYDHIGLVSPHEKDQWTGYRYYSDQEIVLLRTVQALQLMDLSLKEIKEVLSYNDLDKIIAFLNQAEKKADDKIRDLLRAKLKIKRARTDYEKKRKAGQQNSAIFTQQIPRRMILLSETMHHPTVDNLWNYLDHFYSQIEEPLKSNYVFEDLAGIYACEGRSQLFALCTRYPDSHKLFALPGGLYLCANCSEEKQEETLARLIKTAQQQYGVTPQFTVQLILISGILQWNYQIQILLEPDGT